MISPYNLLRHELVGLTAEIAESTHTGYVGLTGEIVDETQKTIKIQDKKGKQKTIPKEDTTLKIGLPSKALVSVSGRLLAARPEERIKKKTRIRFDQ